MVVFFMDDGCVRIGSVTVANKAKDLLKRADIRSRMKKTINEADGCAYLLQFDKKHFDKAALLLKENEISFERCEQH